MGFVNLHGHSSGSQLDCTIKVPELIQKCEDLNMSAVAITDHGNMSSMFQLHEACKSSGKVKPIYAFEAYFCDNRFDKTKESREYNHLTLLAKNQTGLVNLMKLTSLGFIEGFYHKPRIDWELIEKYAEGLVALSGCVIGRVPNLLYNDQELEAYSNLKRFKSIFEHFYLEIQPSSFHGQVKVNPLLCNMAEKTNTPIVLTTDAHYLNKEDFEAHEVLLCMQTKDVMSNPKRFSFECPEFYFCGEEDILERVELNHHDAVKEVVREAIQESERIADLCNCELDTVSRHYPEYTVPYDEEFTEYYLNKFECDLV